MFCRSCCRLCGNHAKGRHIEGIRDSKKLSAKKRKSYSVQIYKEAVAVGIGMKRDARVIDEINIKRATLLAMKDAVHALVNQKGEPIPPEYVLVDAEHIDISTPQLSIISGDDVCYPISCASIVAKVFRDEMMIKMSEQYPQFAWDKNKGYGTREHREAILKYGVTPLHRKSFLKNLLKGTD